ncbi:MAG TPA: ferrochelatase [Gammaproteobacteria bacterium]|nr:ferrochelatase [Gammaproteobacteria bacterium]
MSTSKRIAPSGVLLVNLGSPESADANSVSRWLVEFLSDPLVVPLPRWFWLPLLKWVIAPRRSPPVAKLYQKIWTANGSPLVAISADQVNALQQELNLRNRPFKVAMGMRTGTPDIAEPLAALVNECSKVTILLLYPQYATSTSLSAIREIEKVVGPLQTVATDQLTGGNQQQVHVICSYATDPGYIDALSQSVTRQWQHKRGEHLLMSFHGVPEKTIKQGDPYQDQCIATATALARKLNLESDEYTICYQSRFGRARWLEPATDKVAVELAQSGVRSIDVICPGFSADCLETLEEIALQLKQTFVNAGGSRLSYIPALNSSPEWARAMANLICSDTHSPQAGATQ